LAPTVGLATIGVIFRAGPFTNFDGQIVSGRLICNVQISLIINKIRRGFSVTFD
jgi:hypothetical protein